MGLILRRIMHCGNVQCQNETIINIANCNENFWDCEICTHRNLITDAYWERRAGFLDRTKPFSQTRLDLMLDQVTLDDPDLDRVRGEPWPGDHPREGFPTRFDDTGTLVGFSSTHKVPRPRIVAVEQIIDELRDLERLHRYYASVWFGVAVFLFLVGLVLWMVGGNFW